MLATRIRKDGRVRLAVSTLKTSHLRITLLSYNFSWNNDVKQYLWLLNYTESPLGCSGKCNVSVALGHAVATAAQEIFEAIRAWWKDSLVLNNKKNKKEKRTKITLLQSLEKVFFQNNSNETATKSNQTCKQLKFLCVLSLFQFLFTAKRVSLQTRPLPVYQRLMRGGRGLEMLPTALPAPALTCRDHCWAWEGSAGSTPLKPLASLVDLMRRKAVRLVMFLVVLSYVGDHGHLFHFTFYTSYWITADSNCFSLPWTGFILLV